MFLSHVLRHVARNRGPEALHDGLYRDVYLQQRLAAQGSTEALTDAPTWMVDPVDGTTNFVHHFPFSCVSIGLAINKQVCTDCSGMLESVESGTGAREEHHKFGYLIERKDER